MTAFEDLTGQQFNMLTVIRRATNSPAGRVRWLCQCGCKDSRRLIVQATNLKSGEVKSCGCIAKENHLIHGHSKKGEQSPEYTAWCQMNSRCRNPNHPEYHLYGGIGKSVSETLLNGDGNLRGFEIFMREVGARPSEKHSIELYPNILGNYEEGNIRWAILTTTKRLVDLTGQVFGSLTVLGYGGKQNRKILWRCQCNCEKHTIVLITGDHLQTGHTRSCGCLKDTPTREYKTGHGDEKRSNEYNIWYFMIKRCIDQDNPAYHNYGGRGIIVCNRWLIGEDNKSGYECFLSDMGRRPSKKYSLERKNNNGNYEKDNCCWELRRLEASNTRRNIQITSKGKTQHLRAWAAELGINYGTLYRRYQEGWSIERMLTAPIGKQYRGRFE